MYKTQRLLLVLWASFISTTLFAQTNVNIAINGVEKVLEDNIRLFLSIEQQKDHQLMNEGRLRRLHKKHRRKYLKPYSRLVITARLLTQN